MARRRKIRRTEIAVQSSLVNNKLLPWLFWYRPDLLPLFRFMEHRDLEQRLRWEISNG
jgi:hypothetical protein